MLILAVLAALGVAAAVSLDSCAKDLLPPSTAGRRLRFTKEAAPWEFAIESQFKSIHCCAAGYLSIEWFKDGRPYPWPEDTSSFILYPEAANQTIYTKVLSMSDAGNYTCRLHNDTSYTVHTTNLRVFDSTGYMDHPLATYRPPNTSYADSGRSARLFCEAFVGHIDLPDAKSEVKWSKEGDPTALQGSHTSVELTSRDKGMIVGAYLTIHTVEEADFGTYTCSISNTGDQKIVMTTQIKGIETSLDQLCTKDKLIVFICILATLSLLSFLFCLRRNNFGDDSRIHMLIRKIADISHASKHKRSSAVVVLYSEGNETFIDEVFLPTLRKDLLFNPLPLRVSNWGPTEEQMELCRKVQKVVIVLSKHVVPSWTKDGINEFLRTIITGEARYCVILLQALPALSAEEGMTFFPNHRSTFSLVSWDSEQPLDYRTLFGNDLNSTKNRENPTNSSYDLRLKIPFMSFNRLFPDRKFDEVRV
ncbi:IG [Nesidiocoris tenuis]|uniref:Soluble interferon alpha/beta receptor OPG204 n=2 Tax=Nesidiocoris tenuis TaxID=355587 RepID=A0ABN7ASU5_9HEMI|nr:IG [Nesidiocoris tenuis]